MMRQMTHAPAKRVILWPNMGRTTFGPHSSPHNSADISVIAVRGTEPKRTAMLEGNSPSAYPAWGPTNIVRKTDMENKTIPKVPTTHKKLERARQMPKSMVQSGWNAGKVRTSFTTLVSRRTRKTTRIETAAFSASNGPKIQVSKADAKTTIASNTITGSIHGRSGQPKQRTTISTRNHRMKTDSTMVYTCMDAALRCPRASWLTASAWKPMKMVFAPMTRLENQRKRRSLHTLRKKILQALAASV
mmetsp:Transcript_55088/g.118207  ORF Transcript_55088/g.118207 Transcript_55088/m.118207 type:complete len:246 (+) Transcript_55088:836-1573(+)